MASHTTDLPLPSILKKTIKITWFTYFEESFTGCYNFLDPFLFTYQFTAAGFLSVQKFPLRLKISMSGNCVCTYLSDNSVPFESMFIPIASPVLATNLMKRYLPAILIKILLSLANLLLESNCSFISSKFAGISIHFNAVLKAKIIN